MAFDIIFNGYQPYQYIILILGPIATLIGVFIGQHLTIRYEEFKKRDEGRKRAYGQFLKLFIDNLRGLSIDAENLWNCCIELERYGSKEIGTITKSISIDIMNAWTTNSWKDEIDEHQATNKLINQLGLEIIPKMRNDLISK